MLIYVFTEVDFIKDLGAITHSSNAMGEYKYANQKLFLESYYDVVMCSIINTIAFKDSKNYDEFKEHWNSFDNVLNSTVTCTCLLLIFVFPIYGFVSIVKHRKSLEFQAFIVENRVFLEDVSQRTVINSLYTIFFLARKAIMIMIFIFLNEYGNM